MGVCGNQGCVASELFVSVPTEFHLKSRLQVCVKFSEYFDELTVALDLVKRAAQNFAH